MTVMTGVADEETSLKCRRAVHQAVDASGTAPTEVGFETTVG